jgi:hypothetical protein
MGSFKQYLKEKAENKGAFHRWLGKSEDEPITAADIAKGKAAGGHAAKMAIQAQNFREETEINEVKVGDHVHLGFGVKGGTGSRGHVIKVDGNMVHVKQHASDAAHNAYGPRTFVGPMDRVTVEKTIKEDSENSEWAPKQNTKDNKGHDPYNSKLGGSAPKKRKNLTNIAMRMAQKKGVDPRNSHDTQAKSYKTAAALHGEEVVGEDTRAPHRGKVTVDGKLGEISHVRHGNEGQHTYKVTDLSANDPYKQTRLRGGTYINHDDIKPVKEDIDEAKMEKITAREILDKHDARGKDFHTLSSSQVSGLVDSAKEHGYHKSKNAPGSTGRMFHQHLHRIIGEEVISEKKVNAKNLLAQAEIEASKKAKAASEKQQDGMSYIEALKDALRRIKGRKRIRKADYRLGVKEETEVKTVNELRLTEGEKEVIAEGLRKVSEHEHRGRKAVVYRNAEHDEYQVKFHHNGTHMKDADSFHSDKEDAQGTARHWVSHAHPETNEQVVTEAEHEVVKHQDLKTWHTHARALGADVTLHSTPGVKKAVKNGHVYGVWHGNKGWMNHIGIKEEVIDAISIFTEEVIDEISKKTLGSYVKKAAADKNYQGYKEGTAHSRNDARGAIDSYRRDEKRTRGIYKAVKKLTKEETISEEMSTAAHELVLHADNDAHLHRSSHQPIIANLKKKAKKGTYDSEKAKKLWKYHADRAAQSYHKAHGDASHPWHKMFPTHDRNQAAAHWEQHHRDEVHSD